MKSIIRVVLPILIVNGMIASGVTYVAYQVFKPVQEVTIINESNMPRDLYANLLVNMGQVEMVRQDFSAEIDESLQTQIQHYQEKRQKALSLILSLSQRPEHIAQESSWGWVKYEHVEALPTDSELTHVLQMAFISANIGFMGWDEISRALESSKQKFSKESGHIEKIQQLQQIGME